MLAVDCVMEGIPCSLLTSSNLKYDNNLINNNKISCLRTFVLGRPPGHHAGPNGCVPSEFFYRRPEMTSSGFCLLNTVSVAAAYARSKYGRIQQNSNLINGLSSFSTSSSGFRIAIVDIDVHHGNGTEEIIRNLKYNVYI